MKKRVILCTSNITGNQINHWRGSMCHKATVFTLLRKSIYRWWIYQAPLNITASQNYFRLKDEVLFSTRIYADFPASKIMCKAPTRFQSTTTETDTYAPAKNCTEQAKTKQNRSNRRQKSFSIQKAHKTLTDRAIPRRPFPQFLSQSGMCFNLTFLQTLQVSACRVYRAGFERCDFPQPEPFSRSPPNFWQQLPCPPERPLSPTLTQSASVRRNVETKGQSEKGKANEGRNITWLKFTLSPWAEERTCSRILDGQSNTPSFSVHT